MWRRGLAARFRLLQRHRHGRLILEHVAGRPVVVLPQVFNPKLFRSGEFLARALSQQLVPPGADVLDMGTGSGIGAIAAANWANRVVAVDINPDAVRCARINALLNRLEDRVDVRHGDLFDAVNGERFDVVLFNPPYFRGEPRDAAEAAWRSVDVVERFAAGLGAHLKPGGHALVVLSTDGDTRGFLRAFQASGLAADVVAERDLVNETLRVYRLRVIRPC
ncbi:MAG TPA: HemK2/MTQ2 family protein methyltransferase [Gemmatimonadaceae bacterium]